MSTAASPLQEQAPSRDAPSAVTVTAVALARFGYGTPLWISALPPLGFGTLLAFTVFTTPADTRDFVYGHWFGLTIYLWATLAPMSAALYASATEQTDHSAKRVMYGYAFPRHRVLFGTFSAIVLLWLASGLVLAVLMTVVALAMGVPGDAPAAFGGALFPLLAALPTLVLCLLAAEAWGVAGAACTGVAGVLFGAVLGDKPAWWFVPLAWPTRSALPWGETQVLGGALGSGHPLADPAVLPVLALMSMMLTGALFVSGALYVDRREV